jgi:hypothetical protein
MERRDFGLFLSFHRLRCKTFFLCLAMDNDCGPFLALPENDGLKLFKPPEGIAFARNLPRTIEPTP